MGGLGRRGREAGRRNFLSKNSTGCLIQYERKKLASSVAVSFVLSASKQHPVQDNSEAKMSSAAQSFFPLVQTPPSLLVSLSVGACTVKESALGLMAKNN